MDGPAGAGLWDKDAEAAVLAAAMLSSEAAPDIAESLSEDDFLGPAHKEVFKAVRRLVEQGPPKPQALRAAPWGLWERPWMAAPDELVAMGEERTRERLAPAAPDGARRSPARPTAGPRP